jgi:hypothetical protein
MLRQVPDKPQRGERIDMAGTELTAEGLAALLQQEIYDLEDGAARIGLKPNGLEYAAYRGRIPYVQYGDKKLFTQHDLMQYHDRRGRGSQSKLEPAKHFVVKPGPSKGKSKIGGAVAAA